MDAPIGDFFAVGHGFEREVESLMVRNSSDGRARNCYWPMPFRQKARLTVTNESDKRCDAFYYYIDWQKHPSLPSDTAYFHAMYRQEFPCVMGRNYLIADLAGRGHYVGTVQSVYLMSQTWYGEGDDFFFIDGEKEPRLRGTGTEDYFCGSYNFDTKGPDGKNRYTVFTGPYAGLAQVLPPDKVYEVGQRFGLYRWHVVDPIRFEKDLKVTIQALGWRSTSQPSEYLPLQDDIASVVYWYQTEPHKKLLPLVPVKLRMPSTAWKIFTPAVPEPRIL